MKPLTFTSSEEKRLWLANVLLHLSHEVANGHYGEDGCKENKWGYSLSDVVYDAESNFMPDSLQ